MRGVCQAVEGQCWWRARTSKPQGPAGTQVELMQRPRGSGLSPSMGVKVEGMYGPMGQCGTEEHLCCDPHLISHPTSGENVATDGQVDLSRLEVSLTLTNKLEGLESDTDDTSNQSLLLGWVGQ